MTPPLLSCRTTTEKLISEYEEEKDEFMRSTTLAEFKKMLPASLTVVDRHITMKIQNYWGERTLKDLQMLTQMLIGPGDHLQLLKVSKDSIIVHPAESEPEEAITAAAKSLHAEGVEQVSVVLGPCEPPQGIGFILPMVA